MGIHAVGISSMGGKNMRQMKKWLALLLVAALSICMLAACSGDGDTADETTAATDAAQTTAAEDETDDSVLVMATNAQFPPYEYIDDDGNYAGIDVDIMTEVAKKLGRTLKWRIWSLIPLFLRLRPVKQMWALPV